MIALIWLHVVGLVLWIGSIVAVGVLLASRHGEPRTRGALGYEIYLWLSVPAFVLAFGAGFGRLLSDTTLYFKQTHFMHGKLAVALVAIALHHVLGARAKKMARGTAEGAGPALPLALAIAACAVVAALFVVFRIPD
ncbi:MAG: hypothetical protein HY908_17735 [Myxococcales bacterium]|nr:hypothetical protein [Myxococcales bacterium]